MLKLPKRRLRTLPDGGGYNTWAGAIVLTGSWTGVIGSWVLPKLSIPPYPATTDPDGFTGWWLSSWVGLDGWLPDGSNNVLQIGIDQTITPEGKQYAWAWYEWWLAGATSPSYVNAQTYTGFDVAAGDTIMAFVTYFSEVVGPLSCCSTRADRDCHLPPTVLAPPSGANLLGNSAEWIVSKIPAGGEPGYALAAFDPGHLHRCPRLRLRRRPRQPDLRRPELGHRGQHPHVEHQFEPAHLDHGRAGHRNDHLHRRVTGRRS